MINSVFKVDIKNAGVFRIHTENKINLLLFVSKKNIWMTMAKIQERKYEKNRLLAAKVADRSLNILKN